MPLDQLPIRTDKPNGGGDTNITPEELARALAIVRAAQEMRGAELDFSPKGIRFLCSERLLPGTTLKISSPLFEASAVVKNLSQEVVKGRLFYAIGVSFLTISFMEPRGSLLSTSA